MAQAKHDSITRRALFGALAVPVAAAPVPIVAAPDFALVSSGLQAAAVPAASDPIFAAIGAHARACAELEAHIPMLAAAEQAAWHAPRGQRRSANKRLKEEYAAQGRFCDLLGQATERFVATVPSTFEGIVAALAYVREHYAKGYPVCEEEEAIALMASIETTIRRAANLPLAMPSP